MKKTAFVHPVAQKCDLITGSHHVLLVLVLLPAEGPVEGHARVVDGKVNLGLRFIKSSRMAKHIDCVLFRKNRLTVSRWSRTEVVQGTPSG